MCKLLRFFPGESRTLLAYSVFIALAAISAGKSAEIFMTRDPMGKIVFLSLFAFPH